MIIEILYDALAVVGIITLLNKMLLAKKNKIIFKHTTKLFKRFSKWFNGQLKSPYDKPRPLLDKASNYYFAFTFYSFAFCFFVYFLYFTLKWVDIISAGTATFKVTILGGVAVMLFALLTRMYKVSGDKCLYKARSIQTV